jgi:4-amino-4-deoxy-L-arabinose transferase-like glycosyltransferase
MPVDDINAMDWRRRVLWHAAVAPILFLAATFRLYGLAENGYGRTYYAASVRSMLQSWHAVWFNAFDPAAFVSLDKPPVAIWIQALSAKVLGFSGWSVLLPQAIEGVLAVALVYAIIQRTFGRAAGLTAALLLALSPINIGVDRTNNTDSCLIVVLLIAAWIGMRAAETGSARLLVLAMAVVGIGFNVKMAAAWVLAPALVAAFCVGPAWADKRRCIGQITIAGVVLAVVSLSWSAAFDLTSPDRRPYAGSTTGNSMLELSVLHNGLARFRAQRNDTPLVTTPPGTQETRTQLWNTSPPGPLRLLRPFEAAQMAWWLPLALAGLVVGWRACGGAPDAGPRRIAMMIWGGWLVAYWLAFSFASGVFHTYYLSALGPPLAALAGIGLVSLWGTSRSAKAGSGALALLIVATAAWQWHLMFGQSNPRWQGTLFWLFGGSIGVSLLCGLIGVIASRSPNRASERSVHLLLAVGCLALLPLPIAACFTFLTGPQNPITPAVNLDNLRKPSDDRAKRWTQAVAASREKLLGYLMSQHRTERFIVAVPNALNAAPLIIATGAPVMAIGGYAGTDPILDVAGLKRRVAAEELRFVMLGGLNLTPRQSTAQADIEAWVRSAGTPVAQPLWRLGVSRPGATFQMPINGQLVTMPVPELFDLRPPGPVPSR